MLTRFAVLPAILLAALPAPATSGGEAAPKEIDVFVSGKDGYHTFRIPAVIATKKGTLLAFCEGRKKGRGDSGDIDLVLRRSSDGGKTWGPLQVVADFGPDTVGNPCPVVDQGTGTIWLPLTKNLGNETEKHIRDGTSKEPRTVWMTKSDDDGATWAKPVDVTASVRRDNWTWYATGPGCSIQLKGGRLVVPCNHSVAGTKARHSHVMYSDDGGKTWKVGGVLGKDTNECQAVERDDGTLLMNMRSYHGKNRRAVATSKDGGLTWSEVTLDDALIEPVCQASLIRFTTAKEGGKSRLLFANPASTKREKLTVRLSYDEGKTWPVSRELCGGPSAYSALVALPGGMAWCLYERGEKSPYERIAFARFTLAWLTGGKDSLK